MTLEDALKLLLRRYINAARTAEEAGDAERAALLRLRRERISCLQGVRSTAERRRAEKLWREHGIRERRDEC
jgi:hypothetical protein